MTAAKRLTPQQIADAKKAANLKRRVKRLWKGDLTLDEICEETGMPSDEFLALAASMGLVNRPEPDVYIPTIEEIRLAAASVRSGWSQTELESRRVVGRRGTLD
jgi:hypothetical protein